jgi:hypothetical protein
MKILINPLIPLLIGLVLSYYLLRDMGELYVILGMFLSFVVWYLIITRTCFNKDDYL